MKARISIRLTVVALLLVLAVAVGCSKTPNDAQINSDVQNKLSTDSGLQGKQLAVQSNDGVVTLSGNVDNENQREAAARYAGSVSGVKQVVNNLQVSPAQTAQAPPAEETATPARASKPRASKPRNPRLPDSSATDAPVTSAPPATTAATPATTSVASAPSTPTTPPPPQKVTIPAGGTIAVRLIDTIDTETAQVGQTFRATLDTPLAFEGDVVVPAGYDVQGHVVDVKSAGKFAGQSLLVLQLDRIAVGSKFYTIQTDQYKKEGSSRGKNTAEKVGVGAGIGAIIGAIAGGGKGAAIGAAAGGGVGGGVQAVTKGQQIQLPSETVLNFALQAPLTVVPTTKGPDAGRPALTNNQ